MKALVCWSPENGGPPRWRRLLIVLALALGACVALAEGRREEVGTRAPLILPPLPDAVDAPSPPRAAQTTRLGQVPLAAGQEWTGQYACHAGPAGLRVLVEGVRGETVQVLVEVAGGSYEAAGPYDPATGVLELRPTRWRQEVAGLAMVGLYGSVSEEGTLYEGRVTDPSCRSFTLQR